MDKTATHPTAVPNNNQNAEREKLVGALGDFLSRFHWQVYCTPTFAVPVNITHAKRAMEKWLGALGPDVFGYIAYERGQAGGRTHCHALVGGLYQGSRLSSGFDRRALVIKRAARLWRSGNIKVEAFDPQRGAAWYVSKCPDDGEIVGELKRHRVHRRR